MPSYDDFDGYRKWLNITSPRRPPSHYELLGIKLDEDDHEVIQAAIEQRRNFVESKRGTGHDDLVAEILMRIDEAGITLLNPEMRREYDRQINLFEKRKKTRRVDPNLTGMTSRRIESVPGHVVGEDSGIVKTFAGIMVILCVGFGVMAWFSFQLPWDRQPKNLGTWTQANDNPLDKGEGVLFSQHQGESTPEQTSNGKPPAESFAGNTAGDRKELLPHVAFRWCPPGTFTMGSPETELNRGKAEDQVSVTLSSGFWLSETEVTQGQWERLMGTTPWKSKNKVKTGEGFAASFVSWNDATAYCEKLTSHEREAKRLPEGWKYSLRTEAQWEYACRAGTTTSHSFGERNPSESYSWMSDYGWYDGNVHEGSEDAHPQQVGMKKPNPWGLFDMHGNVWEWCLDWKSKTLMGGTDPSGPASGSKRVRRGGGWGSGILHSRSADRDQDLPDRQWIEIGFRIAAVPSKSQNPSGVVESQTVRITETPKGTFIVKLPQLEVRHQNDWWSVNGEMILGGINGEPLIRRPLMFDGQTSSHSIYMHARPSDEALATYRLEGKFETFESTVLVPDMLPNQGDPRTPLTFKLVGDGRSLWRSKPLGKKGDFEVCHASVSGIKDLSLVIDCPGPENWGLGAWVEPQVSIRATGAEGKSTTQPNPVTFAADVPELTKDTFAKWRDYIVPSKEEREWEKIPWKISLSDAVIEARKTKKPIMFLGMNGHPFANSCANGVRGRTIIFNKEEIQKFSESFVFVADNSWRLGAEENYPGGEFFKKASPKCGQGSYCFTPSGTMLGFQEGFDSPNIVHDHVKMFRSSLEKWDALPENEKLAPVKNNGGAKPEDKIYPASGLVLHVYLRDLPRKSQVTHGDWPANTWNQDFAWFQRDEARRFLPPKIEAGQDWEVPRFLVYRFARFHLKDSVHGESGPFEDGEIKKARLTTHIVAVRQGVAHIEFDGETDSETDGEVVNSTSRPYRRGYDARLIGNGQYRIADQKFEKFELVAFGSRWGRDKYNDRENDVGPAPMGITFVLAGKDPKERLRPACLDDYNWETPMLRKK